MKYSLFILPKAIKELEKLSEQNYLRIKEAILRLGNSPRGSGCSKLIGRDGWKIRVGDYRVIYKIDESLKKVTVLHIGHRRDIYR
jgi:mRNA interferase RelE/StbE